MFGISDLPKFFLAFFLVLPLISILHEGGHVFFAWLMGGKQIRVSIGTGKVIYRRGILEVRQYYFWYGVCSFENLKKNRRISNILIFSGGVIFNGLSALVVIYLLEQQYIRPNQLTYQFTYFSLYYIFFALLPMPYPGGNYSDGKVILDLVRNRREIIEEGTYIVEWDSAQQRWAVQLAKEQSRHLFSGHQDALAKAREAARKNRPSRIVQRRNGKEQEIENFPRLPL